VKAAPRGYLPTLDGWRAIAILGVMVTHATDALLTRGGPHASEFWFAATRYGAKGVDLFFGISGYLICWRLLEEHEAFGRISLKGFYIRRFLRILPPYFTLLAVLGLLALAGVITVGRSEFLHSVFFLRNYFAPAPGAGWYTGHLWSLAVEEHFYLLWPTLLVLWTPNRALTRLAALALLIAVWRVAVFHWPAVDPFRNAFSRYERTDLRLDALLWGCGIALVMWRPAARTWLDRHLTPGVWALALAALIAVIVVNPPLELLWQSLLIPLVLVGTVLRPGAPAGRLLESRPVRWVGRISYSLYLWQQVFLAGAGVALALGPLQRLPLNIALVFVCAATSYYLVERPMIRLGHRLAPPATEGRV